MATVKNKKLPTRRAVGTSDKPRTPSMGGFKGSGSGGGSLVKKGPKLKPGNGKKPKGSNVKPGSHFGAVGPYKGVAKKRVKRLTDGVIRDEVRDLRQQRRQIQRSSNREIRKANTAYERGLGDIQAIYNMVGNQLNALEGDRVSGQANQQAMLEASRAALAQRLGETYGGAANDTSAEAERLGIGRGVNNSGLIADQANAQNMADLMAFVTNNSLQANNNSANNLGSLVSGMTGSSAAGAVGRQLNSYNDSITDIRNNKYDQLNAVNEAIRDARGSRRDVYFQLLQQLQQTGWSQFLDLQNLKMQKKQLKKK